MPRCGERVVAEILTPDRVVLTERDAGRAERERAVSSHRDFNALQILLDPITGAGDKPDSLDVRLDHADPGHFHATKLHGSAANLWKQFLLAGAAHDRLVGLAQGSVKLGQALN